MTVWNPYYHVVQCAEKFGIFTSTWKKAVFDYFGATLHMLPVLSFISGKIGDISKVTKITSKIYAKLSTWLLVKLTQNGWARRQKKFKSRYASLRTAAGLRPTLAFAPLRSK